MQRQRIIQRISGVYILFSATCLFSVSLMAWINPQQVMDLVGVHLPNTDAFSSIRGVYGGVGLALTIALVYLVKKAPVQALGFLALLWGLYALSRVVTITAEGALGGFGTQWLITEAILCVIALCLWYFRKPHTA